MILGSGVNLTVGSVAIAAPAADGRWERFEFSTPMIPPAPGPRSAGGVNGGS